MKTSLLKHRVAICSAHDVALTTTQVILERQKAFETWARIEPMRGQAWMKNISLDDNRENHSHMIWIRWAPSFDISTYAWVFEQRAASGGRWWHVLSVREENDRARWWQLLCRLVEKGDTRQPDEPKPAPASLGPRPIRA